VQLPPGSRVEWVGEFGNLQDAIKRLSIVVPISLALIAVLLWFNFGSMIDTLLAMSVIPMAIFGGVLGLLISGIPFSASAAIGFIALFGIAVMDGIIILSQFNQLIDEGYERAKAVIRTGELQLRPALMTCVVAGVGLLPAALSEGIGSQVQKPLAVVVVTGMALAPLVILVTRPVLISYFSRGEIEHCPHPEEPRIFARRLEGWPQAQAAILRDARKSALLRMRKQQGGSICRKSQLSAAARWGRSMPR
jgi:cobalt-zinc-cadmium resistance protein CzcA